MTTVLVVSRIANQRSWGSLTSPAWHEAKTPSVLNQLKLPTHWDNGTKLDSAPYSELLRHPQIPLVFLIQPWYTNPAESQHIPLKDPSSMGWIWSDLSQLSYSFQTCSTFCIVGYPKLTRSENMLNIYERRIAATFICSVAPVKKIYGVPPPRFNLVSQVLALFHHDWSRFPICDINMFINMMHIRNLSRFWSPPISFWSRFAGETNISSNPAWRHIFFSSKYIHAVAHIHIQIHCLYRLHVHQFLQCLP